ncbi:hypothetical protein AXW83_25665 [Bosea sp. PAMC 26642]|nr:hypothetical protein AXW83_25665 [Bosea sp. PAMC 26642]
MALRSDIKADRLRRRCDDCKEPMRVTKPVARHASERRLRSATEKATKARDARHLARLVKAALAAGGKPLAMAIVAEGKGIRRLRRGHLRSAKMLSVPLSDMIPIEIERRIRLLSIQEITR